MYLSEAGNSAGKPAIMNNISPAKQAFRISSPFACPDNERRSNCGRLLEKLLELTGEFARSQPFSRGGSLSGTLPQVFCLHRFRLGPPLKGPGFHVFRHVLF
jgi:hypothetical protein